MTSSENIDRPDALLGHLTELRRTVRHDRQAYAGPLLIFGLMTLAATPLYLDSIGPDELREPYANPPLTGLGGDLLERSAAIGWYWLAALIVGYLGTLWWYRRHALAVGVQTSTRKYLIAGIAGVIGGLALGPVLTFLATGSSTAVSEVARFVLFPVYALLNLGLVPVLVIAIGVLVLARVERSRLLAATAATLAVVLTAAVAYVNNAPFGGDFPRWGYIPTVLLPAIVLLTAGATAAVRSRRNHP